MTIAIRVKNIGKRYLINRLRGKSSSHYRTLQESLVDWCVSPWRRVRGLQNAASKEELWAVRDISFDVGEGEVIGIIGRNGAGKSTLLKILTRITEPTEGTAELFGRVGSLLEVGTGFHPELTGRENIFLNGSVLGMKRREIRERFDEIVEFSGVERFLDTPVKRYSSGMKVRLAFSVAAHLSPEILIIDEVLAVGDAQFQKKCLGKMSDVAHQGRTVLFVSHQLNQVRRHCGKCVWIQAGRIERMGETAATIAAYEKSVSSGSQSQAGQTESRAVRFLDWEVVSPSGGQSNVLDGFDPVRIRFGLQVDRVPEHPVHHGIALFDADGQLIWATGVDEIELRPGRVDFFFQLPSLPLRPGTYRWLVNLFLHGEQLEWWDAVPEFVVATTPVTHPHEDWQGVLNLPWQFECR